MFKKIRGRLLLIAAVGLAWLWMRRPAAEGPGKARSGEITVETAEIIIPDEETPPTEEVKAAPVFAQTAPSAAAGDLPPDDLTVISGIGPKIAAVLQAAGVTRYDQLVEAGPAGLWQILETAGIRLAKPEAWIEQAKTLLNP